MFAFAHLRPGSGGCLLQDLGFAVRSFVKQPGFAVIAIATLAPGIGANTAIFTVVNAVVKKKKSRT